MSRAIQNVLETRKCPGNYTMCPGQYRMSWELQNVLGTTKCPGNYKISWATQNNLDFTKYPGQHKLSWAIKMSGAQVFKKIIYRLTLIYRLTVLQI